MIAEKVVVGLDFSASSTAIAHWVARRWSPEAELILVHAVDLADVPDFLRGRLPSHRDETETALRGAEIRVREVAETIAADRMRVVVAAGRPSDVLADVAEDTGAGLIVVGEQGERRGLWSLLGSTAEALLHAAPVPVLLLHSPPRDVPDTLLVPVDGSEFGDHVLAAAGRVADGLQARIVLQHVLSPGLRGRVSMVSTDLAAEEFEQELVEATRQWLVERAAQAGLDAAALSVNVTIGAPAYEILAASERLQNAMIVMGSRGAGAMGRLLVGSVARNVIRGASCPVYVVTGAR